MPEGTPGNRPGYKIYSINTTVRNPKRNLEFLQVFLPYDGKPFDSFAKEKYLAECVKRGVYRFTNIDESIKYKLNNDIDLSASEVKQAFRDNPQATGFANRVVTQLRSLKDQGFLDFVRDGRSRDGAIMKITPLGKMLIENNISSSDIYTIAMVALHGKSPIRTAMFNETRPFLNTIFVMDEVKKTLESRHKEFKGILLHEFAGFVLSMKDCDYKKAAKEIIKYRDRFGNSINKNYIENYIYNELGLLHVSFNTLMKDYVDDVYRKFELTGLLRKRGLFSNTYIDFSEQNYRKVTQLLDEYGGYYWHNFQTKEDFYDYIESIVLPWNRDDCLRREVLQQRADSLGVVIDFSQTLEEIEEHLRIISGQTAISKQTDNFTLNEIIKELLILSKDIDEDPSKKVEDLSEPLRLEFLVALLFGKKYGAQHVVSNLIYNDDGEPLAFAPGGKSDISFHSNALNLVIETTMIKNRNQQLNSETANLSRHLEAISARSGISFGMTLVAPYIHRDTCDYFEYTASRRNLSVCPITISRLVEIAQISSTSEDFQNAFTVLVNTLKDSTNDLSRFMNYVNSKYLSFSFDDGVYDFSFLRVIYDSLVKAQIKHSLFCR